MAQLFHSDMEGTPNEVIVTYIPASRNCYPAGNIVLESKCEIELT